MPVTAAQVDLLVAELFPGAKRTRVSVAEWTHDLEGVTVSQLIRTALHKARRTKLIEDLRRQTYYIGGRKSFAETTFYDKVPGSVVRIEHALRARSSDSTEFEHRVRFSNCGSSNPMN
jgi:hypothetical protein